MNCSTTTSELPHEQLLAVWQPALRLLEARFPGWHFVFQQQNQEALLRGRKKECSCQLVVQPDLLEWFAGTSLATRRMLNNLLAYELIKLLGPELDPAVAHPMGVP